MKLRLKRLLVWVESLALMVIVVGLVGFRFLGQPFGDTAANNSGPAGFNVSEVGPSKS